MDFRLTEEQRELETLAARVAKDLADAASLSDANVVPDWSLLVNTGLMGLIVGESDGGSGATLVEGAILAEQLGRFTAPAAVTSSVLIAPAALDLIAPAASRSSFLAELAAGTPFSVVVGADLAWPPRATGVAWGWSRDAVVLAPANEALAPIDPTAVTDPATTEDLSLVVARVTAGSGGPDLARSEQGQRFLAHVNVVLASYLVGCMRSALDLAVEHAKDREQFGVKIGSFQAVKHICADMLVDLESSRSVAYGAAAMLANTSTDLARSIRTAAAAKAWCGDAAIRVCENSIQVHGGMGFTWECPVHRYLRAAHVARASFMSSRSALDVVGRNGAWT